MEPDHPSQLEGEKLDDHAEPLSERSARRRMAGRVGRLGLAGGLLALAVAAAPAAAQDKPRYGGELIFAVPSEMPSYDGHREGTFGMVHPLAPHYNTLLRTDPNDRSGTKIVADV